MHAEGFAAVCALLAAPERWRPMQDAGRRNVERNFSSARVGERMEALYRDLGGALTPQVKRARHDAKAVSVRQHSAAARGEKS